MRPQQHPGDILSREDLKLIFDNSPVSIIITDEKKRIVSWNRFSDELLGLKKKNMYMEYISRLYPKDEWLKIRRLNIRQKGMMHHLETRMYARNSSLIDVEISVSVLKDSKGNIIGSMGIARDITDRKRAEEKLKKSYDELEKFNKFAVGRELRMKELKKKITLLEKKVKNRK